MKPSVINSLLDFLDGDSHTFSHLHDVLSFLQCVSLLVIQETQHNVSITNSVKLVELGLIRLAGLIDVIDELIESGVEGGEGIDDNRGVFIVGEFSETFDIGIKHGNVLELVDDFLVTVGVTEVLDSGL